MSRIRPAACLATLLLLGLPLLSGCGTLLGITVLGAGAVGAAGYGVYKVGEATVDTTADAASATGKGIQKGAEKVGKAGSGLGKAVFVGGEYDAMHAAPLEIVWVAARDSMNDMRFRVTGGNFDALSGNIQALTNDDKDVDVQLEAIEAGGATRIKIRIGVRGDKKASSHINDEVTKRLAAHAQTLTAGPTPALANP